MSASDLTSIVPWRFKQIGNLLVCICFRRIRCIQILNQIICILHIMDTDINTDRIYIISAFYLFIKQIYLLNERTFERIGYMLLHVSLNQLQKFLSFKFLFRVFFPICNSLSFFLITVWLQRKRKGNTTMLQFSYKRKDF